MKKNIKIVLMVCSLTLWATVSCKKEPLGPDIYLAGKFRNEINGKIYEHAAYWKNGVFFPLDEGAVNSYSFDIAVDNNKVYIAGRYNFEPCIWIDGQKKQLADVPWKGIARDLIVKEGKVYISGSKYLDQQDDSNRACLWIYSPDGQIEEIILENEYSGAADLIFSGETLYVSGTKNSKPCYWKWTPASKTRIDLGLQNGYTKSIVLNNNEVLITGASDLENDGNWPYAGGYWKGTKFYPLGHQADRYTRFDELAFDPYGQLCIVGMIEDPQSSDIYAYMYKNDQLLKIHDKPSAANSIFVFNSNVYISGYVNVEGMEDVACYWKNNLLHKMNTPRSTATSITVIN